MGGGVRGASSKPRERGGGCTREKGRGVAEKNPKGLREGLPQKFPTPKAYHPKERRKKETRKE
jgi:hypothetical protein